MDSPEGVQSASNGYSPSRYSGEYLHKKAPPRVYSLKGLEYMQDAVLVDQPYGSLVGRGNKVRVLA
jgi:hypothetical protein